MLFSSWKLTHKIGVSFALIAAMGIAVSLWATYITSSLAARIERLAVGPMVNVESLTTFGESLHTIDRNSQNYVITWDLGTRAQAATEIEKAKKARNEILAQLESRLNDSASRSLLMAMSNSKDDYFKSVSKVLTMANDGAIQGAGQLLVGEVSRQQLTLSKAASELLELQRQVVKRNVEEAQDASESTGKLLLALTGAGSIFCIVAGLLVTKSLAKVTSELLTQMRKVAAGELSEPINVPKGNNEAALMLGALKEMQLGLIEVVSGVRSASDGVALASSEIAQGNTDLSDRTERQAGALQETASSMDDLNNKVAQNADSSQRAHELAFVASQTAKSGGEVVNTVIHTMKEISESSQRIAEIISVINGIAFQTNILALNAAVEAARAGEQGRGFAVVASEVRTLAGRSAEAAKQINELVTTNVERVDRGTALADAAGKTMQQVVDSIQSVTELMVEISTASREQSFGVQQVSEVLSRMDTVTQQNAALVEQMAAAATSLKVLADEQVRAVSAFTLPLTSVESSHENITSGQPMLIAASKH